ncbi:MAG: sialate O-acetylesterase [Leadbetterella sp.]
MIVSISSYSQIDINFPSERAIFQRRNDNKGLIHISGQVRQEVDRVEVKLTSLQGNQGVVVDWRTLDDEVDGLSFVGAVEAPGGWYKLELRSMVGTSVQNTSTLDKVGIGEVFIIGGQSNAQGEGKNINPVEVNDDRVNCYRPNYFNSSTYLITGMPDVLPTGSFTRLSAFTNIGPMGFTSYYWGELGKKLADRFGVPIMFYNTGLSATSAENWSTSINGGDTYNVFTGSKFQQFYPYRSMRRVVNDAISQYGIRAILWHQGESDFRSSENNTFSNLSSIILTTRETLGEKIPWVMARASRVVTTNYPGTINAQNRVINSLEAVFAGPETDNIQPNHREDSHFNNTFGNGKGLSEVAEAWNASLTNSFFSNSTPILAKPIPEIKYTCQGNFDVNFRVDGNYSGVFWNNNKSGNQITESAGEVSARILDFRGNSIYTNKITVSNVFPQNPPRITSPSNYVCVGKTTNLTVSNSRYSVIWNNGTIANSLVVSQPGGIFSARYRSLQGCVSNLSNDYRVDFVVPPGKPTIEYVNTEGFECVGKPITLRVNNPSNFDVEWSNGVKSINTITLTSPPSKPIQATLLSTVNCPSPVSDSLKIGFVAIPPVPELEQNGPFSIRVKNSDPSISGFDWELDNKFLLSKNNNILLTKQIGLYSARSVRSLEYRTGKTLMCRSGLSGAIQPRFNDNLKGMSVYPNPCLDGKLYLSSQNEYSKVKVKVYNALGKEIFAKGNINLNEPVLLNLSALNSKGKHFVEVFFNAYSRVFSVILE